MKFYTYCHIRLDTGKIFYIGKGSANRYKDVHHRNPWWKHIYNKTPIECVILSYWETEQEAFDHEKLMISCIPNLVNLSSGGEGASGYKHTPEACLAKSLALREWHKKNPGALKEWMKKREYFVSEQQKQNLRNLRLGVPLSEETKNKISKTSKGRKKRDGFGKLISESMHKSWSDPTFIEKQKLGVVKARGRAVVDVLSGTIFITVTDAVNWLKENGYPKMSTSWLCKTIKENRSLKNSKFEYKESKCQE